MDSKEAEKLLAKYWACETSLEEERMLRDHFAKDGPTEATPDAAAMFRYFEMQRAREVHDVALDRRVAEIARAKTRTLSRIIHSSLRIAAGIAVLVAAVWLVRSEIRENTPREMVDTYSDPELAFEETKRALLMISRSFGTAEEQAKKLNLFNEAQQQISSEATEGVSTPNENQN